MTTIIGIEIRTIAYVIMAVFWIFFTEVFVSAFVKTYKEIVNEDKIAKKALDDAYAVHLNPSLDTRIYTRLVRIAGKNRRILKTRQRF